MNFFELCVKCCSLQILNKYGEKWVRFCSCINWIKCFIIGKTKSKADIFLRWVFSVGLPQKTHRVFLGMYPSVWTLKYMVIRVNFARDKCRGPHRSQPPFCGGGKISKIWRRGVTKRWQNSCRQIATRYQCSCAGFSLTADYGFIAVYLRLYSRLFTASQPLRLYGRYV